MRLILGILLLPSTIMTSTQSLPLLHLKTNLRDTIEMHDAKGRTHVCRSTNIEQHIKDEGDESSSAMTLSSPKHFSSAGLDNLMTALRGVCLTFSAGWWQNTWCHESEVFQVHKEGQEVVTRWSLGNFESSRVVKDDEGDALFVAQTFSNGQFCDETQGHRSTEARLFCCDQDDTSIRSPIRPGAGAAAAAATAASHSPTHSVMQSEIVLKSFLETSLCAYTVSICWPALCEVGIASQGKSKSKDPNRVLRTLYGLCFEDRTRLVTFCVEKDVKQQHHRVDGKFKFVKSLKIHAGTYDPSFDTYAAAKRYVERLESRPLPSNQILQVYANGDACGPPESHLRITTVARMACLLSASVPAEIVSFYQTEVCWNILLFHVPDLCPPAPKGKMWRDMTVSKYVIECDEEGK